MAALVQEAGLRLLRPLLCVPPACLRATLRAAGVGWAEDPSNADRTALRPRLRALRADRAGTGPATAALAAAACAAGAQRARAEAEATEFLAAHVTFRPEGFALLPASPMPPEALRAVIAVIGGAAWPPPSAAIARLAAAPRPATLAGVRLLAAGRLGPGLLVVREAAAMAPPMPAKAGAVWDRRFRLTAAAMPPPGSMLGALDAAQAGVRRNSELPAAVLRTLPALWQDGSVVAVPHLEWPDPAICSRFAVLFAPARPAGSAGFVSAGWGDRDWGCANPACTLCSSTWH
jgi:tRNA(Ile)-lysidine synthase